ncbi:MAG: SDR family oxidoreductase [SAR324 cluster bacterium]|nr:SDR family oxidoreductase [SAR324 cluster bacterium]
MESRMDGRKALITGGSMGLGRAIGARFAASGADVALVARRPEMLEEAKAEISAQAVGKVHTYPCDVTDPKALQAMFAQATSDMGQVDILVNNAGTSQTGKFEDITDEVWQSDFDLKLFAAIRLARLAFPGMKERRWGRIINVLNVGAKAPSPGGAPTAVSRAAGMALTKVLSGEGAPHNVLVNALCTGLIRSDQWVRRHKQEGTDMSFDDWLKEKGKSLPMGRYGEAEEFANMACFLASDSGSYITGTAINVDGGRSPVV